MQESAGKFINFNGRLVIRNLSSGSSALNRSNRANKREYGRPVSIIYLMTTPT
jgi:hypothetical protein